MVVKSAPSEQMKEGDTQAEAGFKAVAVLPSILQITKLIKAGMLPPDTIDALRSGSTTRLNELTPQQQCLAAGFSGGECARLEKKPHVKEVGQFDVTSNIPMPEYEAEYAVMQ